MPSRRRILGMASALHAAAAAAAVGWGLGPRRAAAEGRVQMKQETMPAFEGKEGKKRTKFSDFKLTDSGLQVREVDPGRTEGVQAGPGDTVVLTWEGFTINYFGRPFESRKLQEVSNITPDPLRFRVGDGTVIPGIDEGVRGLKENGIRQLIVPVELGYDAQKKLLPRPCTFSGQRALDFVLDNKGGIMDKTLLINISLKRVYKE